MRVVIDTNVVVSSILSPSGTPATVMRHWRHKRFTPLVSPDLLDEYHRALTYPHLRTRHGADDSEVTTLITELIEIALVVVPTRMVDVIQDDPSDNRVLECAVTGEAQFIVSGDQHLRQLGTFEAIRIISPRAFVLLLETNGELG